MLLTKRLELVPATPALTRAALEGAPALAASLGAVAPLTWRAGYKGPPSQRRGYAFEAVRGLPAVRRVIAETLPELAPSIGVLHKCGFRLIGDGSEPGVIRFELRRAEYSAG